MNDFKGYNLFLDDMRHPTDCLSYMNDSRYEKLEWIIVKNHEEFMREFEERLQNNQFPELVSFDHDLDHEHYHPTMYQGVDAYENAYLKFDKPTGRRSAEYLRKRCMELQLPLPECLIHTMNPAGKIRIEDALFLKKQ